MKRNGTMLLLLLSFASLCLTAFGQADALHSYEEAEATIRSHLAAQPSLANPLKDRSLCEKYTCCSISSGESCPITKMPQDQTTLVLPGGQTRCIFSDSTPFAFQVVPGDADKLIFYFQGGGACWNEGSTKAKLCTTDASPQSLVGIFDRSSDKNAFKDYTIVHVLYCSGDVHGGNTTRPYTDSNGQPVVQVGLENGQSALNWVKQQVAAKNLADVFSSIVVMGASAGSIGAQLWGKQVLSSLKWETAAVVPDSYAGVFPPGSMGPMIYDYGFCTSGFLSQELEARCNKQALTLQDMDMEFMGSQPTVPYAFIQSKTDIVQQAFYIAIALSMNSTNKLITPTEFYKDVNNIFGLYNKQPNFVNYLVDGYHHCFTNQDLFYDADTSGPHGSTDSTLEKLYSWTNTLPLSNGQTVSSQCGGTVQGNLKADNTYCSSKVVPKTFTEKY